jgi:CheY-like chemotaxis protein
MIRVLIVDDDPDVASVLNDAVTGFGHRTAVALSGGLALRAAREFVPHDERTDVTGFSLAWPAPDAWAPLLW